MAPDYDHLTLMQKVEVFESALENTQGDDLAKIFWLKSPSSETWFDRRTNYTRSLAVMSMVGYILGLGDRHPSNIMLDRMSGKIVHIDFGDCFEVAIHREKFPEKIPFRLTRMLISAMEVTGLEGNYRITCERVMGVLRENGESLMAVLEAFVYDPLINWRLIDTAIQRKDPNGILGSEAPIETGLETELNTGIGAVEPGKVAPLGLGMGLAVGLGAPGLLPKLTVGGLEPPGVGDRSEVMNKKALEIIQRIKDKLSGCDFIPNEHYDVPTQVEMLIQQATSRENLCQCYIGWCPFW